LDRNDTAACRVTLGTNPMRFVDQACSENVVLRKSRAMPGFLIQRK
jgi:hypothetical protein